MQMLRATKTCLACHEVLKGRADKKFCDDYCRSAYNNKLNSQANPIIRNVNSILRRNRRILEELTSVSEANCKTNKLELQEKGFNFKYVTHTYVNKKGLIYYFCYDYGYLPLNNDFYLLIKRKEQ